MSFSHKIKVEMSQIAKENVDIDVLAGVVYVFGSELACLRIFYHRSRIHGLGKEARVRYSSNVGSWYYCDEEMPTSV